MPTRSQAAAAEAAADDEGFVEAVDLRAEGAAAPAAPAAGNARGKKRAAGRQPGNAQLHEDQEQRGWDYLCEYWGVSGKAMFLFNPAA